jgi:hypothetical protein
MWAWKIQDSNDLLWFKKRVRLESHFLRQLCYLGSGRDLAGAWLRLMLRLVAVAGSAPLVRVNSSRIGDM